MPIPMKKVEISIPESTVFLKVVGMMAVKEGMELELFEIHYDDLLTRGVDNAE